METGNKDGKKKTRNNQSDISLNENENTKKFTDSMNQNQIPINQLPIERKNDIRESHDDIIDGLAL